MTATVSDPPDEPRGTGVRAEISETVKRALYAMSNGTCYAPDCVQPVMVDTGPGGVRLNVEVSHIYGVKPKAPRFRSDLTDRERDDWRHLLLMCEAHHGAIDDPKTGEENYPAETLLEWKAAKERQFGKLTGAVTQESMERLLREYFEAPSERLASLVDRLDEITAQAERTGQLSAGSIKELRLLVSMLADTGAYQLAESARSLNQAAEIYSGMNIGGAARSLAASAELLANLDLGQKARQLLTAAEQLNAYR
ncbi:hypothetical protein [Actinoplanes sp. NPDC049118]|uniref:hypothetical protein n=1 Tax=Actinoplanes sp. NPDC049118 TaxID=3155769 RepID=UPI0034079678